MKAQYIIYALLCPKCGCPRYIGKSSSGLARVKHHLETVDNWDGKEHWDGSRHKINWVRALRLEGRIPSFVILTILPTSDYLDAAEIFWIAEMKRRGCPLTNLTLGGGGTYGYKQSQETIEKRRAKLLGRVVSEECKTRISESLKGRPSQKKGRPLTPEEKIKHAVAHAIPPFQDQHGRVYTTIKEASEAHGLSPGNICNVLKRKRPSTGGFVFTHVHELESMAKLDMERLDAKARSKEETRLRNRERTRLWNQNNPDYMKKYLKNYRS